MKLCISADVIFTEILTFDFVLTQLCAENHIMTSRKEKIIQIFEYISTSVPNSLLYLMLRYRLVHVQSVQEWKQSLLMSF